MKTGQSKNKLTNKDLQAIGDLLDKHTAVLATKEELKNGLNTLETNLKGYIHEGIETVIEGMENLAEELNEKEKVDRLVEWARKAGDKIGIKPKM